ncbi:hypothetical protein KC19_1G300300 [Ceratodon purpureus]|uniref:Uncharacterized protein n=1 Tax=Ceratodon purpureus TaxID=3225 RepID=A0A8T0JC44_CERPU|nr:hypothetical protein KC19_1G300300 [Ceratodon purpureus]
MWPLCDAQSRGLQHEGFEVVYRVMACRECLVCDTLIKFLGRSIKAKNCLFSEAKAIYLLGNKSGSSSWLEILFRFLLCFDQDVDVFVHRFLGEE